MCNLLSTHLSTNPILIHVVDHSKFVSTSATYGNHQSLRCKKSVQALEKTLGHKISPQAQWPALWNELKDRYPDKATFVPTICRITIAWYERLLWRLDSDNFPEWTEEFLSSLSDAAGSGGRIQLHIEVRAFDFWKNAVVLIFV